MITFDIQYDTFRGTATVLQNGSPVSQYSQFYICSEKPLRHWIADLSAYCEREANGAYHVHYIGEEIVGRLLQGFLQPGDLCQSFRQTPPRVKAESRLAVLTEYRKRRGQDVRITVPVILTPGMSVMQISGMQRTDAGDQISSWIGRPLYLMERTSADAGAILLASCAGDLQNIPAPRDGGLALIMRAASDAECHLENGWYACYCTPESATAWIAAWTDGIVIPQYLRTIERSLRADAQDTTEQLEIAFLYGSTPMLHLSLPARLEVGHQTRAALVKFPADMPCTLSVSTNSGVRLSTGGVVTAIAEHHRNVITAQSKEWPEIRAEAVIETYSKHYVRQVQLTVSSSAIFVGNRVSCQTRYAPLDACDANQILWRTSPAGILREIKAGQYEAIRVGTCTIVVQIGNVSASVEVRVQPSPRSIDLPVRSLTCKLPDETTMLGAQILPRGAVGGQLSYRVYPPDLVDIDPMNGEIRPRTEGTGCVTITLTDAQSAIIDEQQCTITVKPADDVYNPRYIWIALAITTIMTILCSGGSSVLCGLAAMACLGWLMLCYKERQHRIALGAGMFLILILMLVSAAI